MSELAIPALAAFGAGFLIGAAYFAALWRSVRTLSGGAGWRAFIIATAVRLMAIAGLLALLAAAGIDPALLVPGLLGFLAARLAATAPGRGASGAEEP